MASEQLLTDGVHRVGPYNVFLEGGRVVAIALPVVNEDGTLTVKKAPFQVYSWGNWSTCDSISPSGFRKTVKQYGIKINYQEVAQ